MKKNNKKKSDQIGVPIGTATHRLRKMIMFSLLKELNKNVCHQCNELIATVDDLSIEHIIPYLDSENPKELFYDLNNIGFSHLRCNVNAARKRVPAHPSYRTYRKGCRCEGCKEANNKMIRKYRNKKKNAPIE